MLAEVLSLAPHLLHSGLSDSPIRWRCLLRVLCPVRRPVTALDCVLLKDRNLALAPRQVPEINSRVCLWVLSRPRHHTQCWWTDRRLILLLMSCLEPTKAGSVPTDFRLANSSATSFPPTLACPGTQYNPTACRVELKEAFESAHLFYGCFKTILSCKIATETYFSRVSLNVSLPRRHQSPIAYSRCHNLLYKVHASSNKFKTASKVSGWHFLA